tara:strand:- start:1526 stop:3133 length:1608 start_codon:yes stop_codon:yes gene_type:complete
VPSPGITAFIQKAIINNLKILQAPGVFNDEKEQAGVVDTLKALQLQLDEEKVASSSFFSGLENFPSIWNPLANLFTSNHLATDIASFDTSKFITTEPHQPLASPVREMHLLSDLSAAIDQCKAKQETDPLWVMAQIDQLVLQLPIPLSYHLEKPHYESISFYHQLTTANDFYKIENCIDELHCLYRKASRQHLNQAILSTQVITFSTLLVLRDYFDAMGEAVTFLPAHRLYNHSKLASSLEIYYFSATGNPAFDKRLVDIMTFTHSHPNSQERDYVADYMAILDSEPLDVKTSLEAIYSSRWFGLNRMFGRITTDKYKNNRDETVDYVVKNNLTALFVLFSEMDWQGQIKIGPVLSQDLFKPLIKKIQRHFELTKKMECYLRPFTAMDNASRFFFLDVFCESFGFHKGGWTCLLGSNRKIGLHLEVLPDYKYKLTRFSPENQALNYSTKSRGRSNKIQLIPDERFFSRGSHFIQQDEYFSRDLKHLRSSPAHVIKLTLDYFSKSESMAKLADHNTQLDGASICFSCCEIKASRLE